MHSLKQMFLRNLDDVYHLYGTKVTMEQKPQAKVIGKSSIMPQKSLINSENGWVYKD